MFTLNHKRAGNLVIVNRVIELEKGNQLHIQLTVCGALMFDLVSYLVIGMQYETHRNSLNIFH